MGKLLVGHGGCGSAAMIKRLWESGQECHGRPDIAFFPSETPSLTLSSRAGMQILSENGYHDKPTPDAARLFAERTNGYRLDLHESIQDNLTTYVYALAKSGAFAWFCRAPGFGFLTRAGIADAACLVRNPLNQYLSFTQPYRHPDWAESLGGRFSEEAIRLFASAWNSFTADCLDSGSRIIRYEYALQDVADDEFLSWLFHPLRSSKHYHGLMPAETEQLLCELTEPVWSRVYDSWSGCKPKSATCDA